jgi:hypothetical protein
VTSRERLLHFGLVLPTQHMILESLARYLDDDEVPVIWAMACQRAGVDPADPPEAEALLPLVDALESCGELAAVCAKGLRIRILSYQVLARSVPAMASPVGV